MEQRIQKAVERFAVGLTKEIVAVIYDDLITDLQVQRASNKGTSVKANGKSVRRNGKTTRKTAKKVAAKNGNGAKRTPAQIEKLAARALATVQKTPGQSIETIAKSMRANTKDLSLPMRKLIADKEIRTKGERRATKYFPKPTRKTATKKKTAKKKATKKK